MAHTELDLRERRMIETMLTAKMPVSRIADEIARRLGQPAAFSLRIFMYWVSMWIMLWCVSSTMP